jgi:phospholipid/cholesterol/gamma-HCH transport system ATP-binding protein
MIQKPPTDLSTEKVIEINGLNKSFGNFHVLRGVN